jgi:hypothetical protein
VNGDDTSIRPPDLAPETVRGPEDDVLAGWDLGAGPDEVASWQRDRRPFPTDTVVVVGTGVIGLLAGVALDRDHRGRGALIGGSGGLVAASVARRLWVLEN